MILVPRTSDAHPSWISSVMTTFVFMFSILSGRYFDSHGARTLLISGSVIFTAAQIGIACESDLPASRLGGRRGGAVMGCGGTVERVGLTKVSEKYWHLMLSHAFVGIAGSFLYSPATAVAGHWFLRKRSTAVGIVVCGSGLAGVIYPIMIKRLIELLGEWCSPLRVSVAKTGGM